MIWESILNNLFGNFPAWLPAVVFTIAFFCAAADGYHKEMETGEWILTYLLGVMTFGGAIGVSSYSPETSSEYWEIFALAVPVGVAGWRAHKLNILTNGPAPPSDDRNDKDDDGKK